MYKKQDAAKIAEANQAEALDLFQHFADGLIQHDVSRNLGKQAAKEAAKIANDSKL